MEITQCKWPGIKNWTYEDLVDREMIEMLNGKIGLVEVLEDDHEENENAEKNKLKEVSRFLKRKKIYDDLLKKNLARWMHFFNGDEKVRLFVESFKKVFNKGNGDIEENNAGSSGNLLRNEEAKKEAAAKEREEAEKQKNHKRKEQAAAKKKEE
ncbi:hypothetical protein Tco_0377652 [Tanacetum coccineum]